MQYGLLVLAASLPEWTKRSWWWRKCERKIFSLHQQAAVARIYLSESEAIRGFLDPSQASYSQPSFPLPFTFRKEIGLVHTHALFHVWLFLRCPFFLTFLSYQYLRARFLWFGKNAFFQVANYRYMCCANVQLWRRPHLYRGVEPSQEPIRISLVTTLVRGSLLLLLPSGARSFLLMS